MKRVILGFISLMCFDALAEQYTIILQPNPMFLTAPLAVADYKVVNQNNIPLQINVTLQNYAVGSGPFAQDKSIANHENFNLAPYLQYSPANFTIKANSQEKVALRINLPQDAKPGTYFTGLRFDIKPLVQPAKSAAEVSANPAAKDESAKGFAYDYSLMINQASLVYFNVGQPAYTKLAVTCINKAPGQVLVQVLNSSPFVFSPTYSIYEVNSDKPLVSAKLTSVLGYSEAKRDFNFDSKDKSAHYQISWVADNGDKSPGMIVCH